jgi:negative regulator of flagellin synthesis FlgM
MTLPPIATGNRPAPIDAAAARPAPNGAPAAPAPAAPATDSVALSGAAAAVRDLAAAPPVDEAKVASLKAAIAAGTYTVDAQAIADKMLALDLP